MGGLDEDASEGRKKEKKPTDGGAEQGKQTGIPSDKRPLKKSPALTHQWHMARSILMHFSMCSIPGAVLALSAAASSTPPPPSPSPPSGGVPT